MQRLPVVVLWALLIIGIVVGVWVFLSNGLQSQSRAAKEVLSVVPVQRGSFALTVTGTGTVTARDAVDIKAEAKGIVKEVAVSAGDRVQKGDVLVRLENPDLDLAVRRAEVELQLALKELADMLDVSVKEALKAKFDPVVTVKSPYLGRVELVNVRPGDVVTKDKLLLSVRDESKVDFVVRVLANEFQRISVGNEAQVTLEDFSGVLHGQVYKLNPNPKRDRNALWHEVYISLDNPGLLQQGMRGNAVIWADSGTVGREGEVRWRGSQEVRAPVNGKIRSINVKPGDSVRPGSNLLALERAISAEDVKNQRLVVEQRQLNLESKRREQSKLVIRSPISGTVTEIKASVSKSVESGDLIARVADYSTMNVVIQVNELEISKLRVGQPATIIAEAIEGRRYEGVVEEIAAEGNRRFGVRISVKSPELLKAGMTVKVSIIIDDRKNVLMVPIEAITYVGGGAMVRVMQNGEPVPRLVQTGLTNERWAEVISGLNEGDKVVVTGKR